ncbi:Holliday junction resolvase RuvX [Ornithobacterium rhinotracheale]|uniref:Holliday junction resolvase RuvX n=1 Tax=Ornithobacterium rhinotracheale TaxID=28251 RepID=UPI00129C35D7|nr:Holliday junction resolvase RuvX [Ornithobacterium rhinotracheale]MCK0204251.1 Holliday junction resolvase RuvX [Ornithobacterium rhinotracheale]MRJ11549.1 Holliday junction resolvase RuvX [Ornithobacterium rhinotracheale]
MRILAIDYGKVKTGLAVTDPLRIIASALDTVPTKDLMPYLEKYFATEPVSDVVIGLPMRAHGVPGEIEEDIQLFIQDFQKKYPKINIHREDESYTSIRAAEAIFMSGAKKKKRRDKTIIDRVSATLILQSFMERNG